jgi:hypothetical protein
LTDSIDGTPQDPEKLEVMELDFPLPNPLYRLIMERFQLEVRMENPFVLLF